MFTPGRLIFAILFFIAFVAVVAAGYRKDRATHQKYYKGSIWILVGFILFILALFGIKFFLKG